MAAPPYIDYLTDHFGEGARTEIEPGVEQYRFFDADGSIRVTTDDAREPGGVSAWWIHGKSENGLLRLAKRAAWCCGLPSALKAASEPGRRVLVRLREG